MKNYNSAEEKAAEWSITPRHVQYLCRTGKIKDVLKVAGVWLIPNDAPIPVKNSKSNAAGFNFVGTKNKIFSSAIELFMLKGFGSVSLIDIANAVGINQSTVYNHFKSKQDILDTIYDFYCYHFLNERPSLKDMEYILQKESIMAIIGHIRYNFKYEIEQKMSDITKIIFQRIAIDDRAREIGKSLMVDEGVKYVENVFNMGVEMGRFAPFDTHSMAIFINSVRIFTLYNWIVDPSLETTKKLAEDEHTQYTYAAGHINDLNPPAES